MTQKIEKQEEIGWNFTNTFAQLSDAFFTEQRPTPVRDPKLVVLNKPLAMALGLKANALESEKGIATLAGNNIPAQAFPLAQAYAGHQFGQFTMLGDGRAILLGEQITPSGERLDIQLKGAGRTRYSRGGDGRAALGPMLREYIISEAMHGLGIPTSRSLAVVTTGEPVYRETPLPGAILTRVANSHIRVGTFEYIASWGTLDELKELADYTIERHFPEVQSKENPYVALLEEVVKRQASVIAKWQLVGFIHGVMNTDNMTVSGETIDYGPCAFMDVFDPKTVFSSIDAQGRYAYGNQPGIGEWNLIRFAEALVPLLDEEQEQAITLAQEAVGSYASHFYENWFSGMRVKLGLFHEEEGDRELVKELLDLMKKYEADFTNTFRSLTLEEEGVSALFASDAFQEWRQKWEARRSRQSESKASSIQVMKESNPCIIPRNHRVEEALEAVVERGDDRVMKRLLEVLSRPFAFEDDQAEYATLPDSPDRWYQTFCGT